MLKDAAFLLFSGIRFHISGRLNVIVWVLYLTVFLMSETGTEHF